MSCEPLHRQTRMVEEHESVAEHLGTGVLKYWISLSCESVVSVDICCAYVLSAVRSVCSFLPMGLLD